MALLDIPHLVVRLPSSSPSVASAHIHAGLVDDATQPNGFSIAASSSSALQSISSESNKLIEVINEIGLLNLDGHKFEVPKIVTIGDQSAGKSSAIAALSGITVPRSAGMCTRVGEPSNECRHKLTENSAQVISTYTSPSQTIGPVSYRWRRSTASLKVNGSDNQRLA